MEKQNKIELNNHGLVLNKGIHDAAIIETSMSGEGDSVSAIVRCRSEEGTQFTFRFQGVRLFSVNFFGSQNIIRDCVLVANKDAQQILSGIKDLELYSFERVDVLNDLIKKGEFTILKISSSNGAEIDCICKTLDLEY